MVANESPNNVEVSRFSKSKLMYFKLSVVFLTILIPLIIQSLAVHKGKALWEYSNNMDYEGVNIKCSARKEDLKIAIM